MTKYTVEIEGKPYEVEIEGEGPSYSVIVDGVPYEVSIQEERVREEKTLHAQGPVVVSSPSIPTSRAMSPGSVPSPMPGTILKIHAVEGKTVSAGDLLFTLEAMKMENQISSPLTGTLKRILVKEGQAVNTGDSLAIIS
ncbi:MAG: biotin/lipoyl-binding protein [Theionarchaea archaeon]|nr:biotin/lipoyl-binding protein [Theionarchaea archaeon]MBU7038015.1 biotin/lipoyl-binding protein [Theionarchaea archaeon]